MKILIVAETPEGGQTAAASLMSHDASIRVATTTRTDGFETELAEQRPTVILVEQSVAHAVEKLKALVPEASIVLMCPRVDNAEVDAAVRYGVNAIVRTPFEPSMLLKLLAAPAPTAEFNGRAAGVPTAMLLALHCSAGNEGVLYLKTEDGRGGAIHLESGQPVHASFGATQGPEAVRELLNLDSADATWLAGRTGCARTIIGRWEGLLHAPSVSMGDNDDMLPVAYPDVMEKLARLSQTPDILGAFLLRNAEVVTGRCSAHLDEAVVGRSLRRLAHVFHDVEAQHGADAGGEIQATVGTQRLVVDRLGPPELGFQVGVVVRQASPVCKSLRRLLRQVDRSFRKSLKAAAASGEAANQMRVGVVA